MKQARQNSLTDSTHRGLATTFALVVGGKRGNLFSEVRQIGLLPAIFGVMASSVVLRADL